MRLFGKIFLLLFFASPAWAQYVVSVRAGLINYVEGRVYLDESPFEFNADHLQELEKGQYLRTGTGKAEVQLGPGASLWMDENGSLQMVNPSLTDTRLRIERGSIFIEIIEKYKNNKITIQMGTSVIELKETGLYRLDSALPYLYVFNGKAEIRENRNRATVKQGKFADLNNNLEISKFDKDWKDTFRNWTTQRSFVIYRRIRFARMRESMAIRMAGRRHMWELEHFARQQMQQQQQQQRLENLRQQQMQMQPSPYR
jgi:hypothetical protein